MLKKLNPFLLYDVFGQKFKREPTELLTKLSTIGNVPEK
jgi:hypothetical protein